MVLSERCRSTTRPHRRIDAIRGGEAGKRGPYPWAVERSREENRHIVAERSYRSLAGLDEAAAFVEFPANREKNREFSVSQQDP